MQCEAGTRFLVPGGRGAAPWVALVARGGCTFKEKVLAAARRNASAVVLYNEERHGNLTAPMSHAGKPPARGDGRGGAAVRWGPSRPRGPPRGGGDGLRMSGPARVAPAWLDVTPGSLRREASLRTELHLLPVKVKGAVCRKEGGGENGKLETLKSL